MKVICPTQSPCTASTSGAKVTVFVYDAQGQLTAEYGTASGTVRTDYLTADQLGSTRVIVDQTGAVLNCYDYYPFGEDIAAGTGGRPGCFGNGAYPGSGPDEASQKFTGKERDWETGLDYFGARYMSSAQGRFTSPDPTFLNIRKVVSPQRWNLYGYALNNPLRYVDPDGEETIAVYYPGYQVGVRNDPKITMPLGHAGVVVVRKDGSTHYFEYGRYHGPVGETRNAGEHNTPTPSLQRDASGKITPDSMKDLLSTLSEASGKSGQVDALVFDTASIEDAVIEAYLNAREQENGDPNRQHYSPYSHNCGTLICEAFDKAGHPGPGSFQRWGLTPGNIFDQLSLMSGPSQQFSYKPKKEKVTSKICYTGDNGKKVCQ
jgi:RHS repeat-associated protein